MNLGSFDDFARTSANQFDQSTLPPRLHAPSPIVYKLNVRDLVARGAPVTLAALGALLWLIGRRAR